MKFQIFSQGIIYTNFKISRYFFLFIISKFSWLILSHCFLLWMWNFLHWSLVMLVEKHVCHSRVINNQFNDVFLKLLVKMLVAPILRISHFYSFFSYLSFSFGKIFNNMWSFFISRLPFVFQKYPGMMRAKVCGWLSFQSIFFLRSIQVWWGQQKWWGWLSFQSICFSPKGSLRQIAAITQRQGKSGSKDCFLFIR